MVPKAEKKKGHWPAEGNKHLADWPKKDDRNRLGMTI